MGAEVEQGPKQKGIGDGEADHSRQPEPEPAASRGVDRDDSAVSYEVREHEQQQSDDES